MPRPVRSDLDFLGVSRLRNVPNAQAADEPVNLAQMTAAQEATAWKDNVRVSTQANLNLTSPGASVSGIAMNPNDRVLVRANTTQTENGLYIWNGPSTPMTRAPDASTSDELEQAVVSVDEGVDAGTTWRQTQVNFTLGTGNVIWAPAFASSPPATETTPGISELATQAEVDAGTDATRIVTPATLAAWSGRLRKVAAVIGDNTATQIDVTHNLGTRDVVIEVYRNATPWDSIFCDVERPDLNTARFRFSSAPTAAQLRVVIEG